VCLAATLKQSDLDEQRAEVEAIDLLKPRVHVTRLEDDAVLSAAFDQLVIATDGGYETFPGVTGPPIL